MKKTDELVGKAAGMAKQVKSKLSGDTGIFSTLKKEHGEVSGLLGRIPSAEPRERREILTKIKVELFSHANAEEASFYRSLQAYPDTSATIESFERDHNRLEELLERMQVLEPSEASWMDLYRQLKTSIEEHVEKEEQQLFPRAEQHLSDDDAKRIDATFKELKQQHKEQLQASGESERPRYTGDHQPIV